LAPEKNEPVKKMRLGKNERNYRLRVRWCQRELVILARQILRASESKNGVAAPFFLGADVNNLQNQIVRLFGRNSVRSGAIPNRSEVSFARILFAVHRPPPPDTEAG
jgi:hypothetical protein